MENSDWSDPMIIPPKPQLGDQIRVVAPSRSLSVILPEQVEFAKQRLESLGFRVTFGKHVYECDEFLSSSVESRVQDLHEAFADPDVKMILTAVGGFNCNQILRYLDYDLIAKNPKILCGYSDITALSGAILAKTGLVTYSGPFFSTFAMKKGFEYHLEYFHKCLLSEESYSIHPSPYWSNDAWYRDQENRIFIPNEGWMVINEGEAEGTIIGSNLCTLNLLQGTEYMPDLTDAILFLEEDDLIGELTPLEFDRNLQSLIHLPDFPKVKALVISRFVMTSKMTEEKLIKIIKSKKELEHIPVIANLDFGHTHPFFTFPIGGKARVKVSKENSELEILIH